MSKFSKIFWWATLALSLTISIYQLVTTGASETYHLLASLISIAVIDLSKQQEVCNGL